MFLAFTLLYILLRRIDKTQDVTLHNNVVSLSFQDNNRDGQAQLSDTFKERWKEAFEQYRYKIDSEERRDEIKHSALARLTRRSYFDILLSEAVKEVYREKRELLLIKVHIENYKSVAEGCTYEQLQSAVLNLTDFIERQLAKDVTLAHTAQDAFFIIIKSRINGYDFRLFIHQFAHQLREIDTGMAVFRCKLGATYLSYRDKKNDVSRLFYQVNNALYSISDSMTKNYAFYQTQRDREKKQHQDLVADLRFALIKNNGELELYFQPQIDFASKEVLGAEALVRWRHPEKGFLTPDRFVHLLNDDIQLNIRFGEWVIESAVKMLSKRTDSLTISVNITPVHLQQEDFFKNLKYILDAYPRSVAQRLKIELTETGSISNHNQVGASMRRCSELGVHFSLDDFGTGYSTLSQLRLFPATEIKIDRSFVQHLENSEDDQKMISTMITLARNFGIDVVVEGIENTTQQNILSKFEHFSIQGYLYSKPIPYIEFEQWIQDYNLDKEKAESPQIKRALW